MPLNLDPSIAPPDEPDPALGRAIRRLREERGLSLAELAELSGVDRPVLAALEDGTLDPAWETVGEIARALGLSLEALAEERDAGS